MTFKESAIALKDNLAKLGAKDQAFAESLLGQYAQKGSLSEKQAYWVEKLAARATKGDEPVVATPVGDISGIVQLIQNAKSKLKFPRVLLLTDVATLRVSLAGPASKMPGSVMITENEKQADGRYVWVGRITVDGKFIPGKNVAEDKMSTFVAALTLFAADPAGVAKAYGIKTGHCCFCARELTDKVSVGLGYGPICAERWGLPHKLTCE